MSGGRQLNKTGIRCALAALSVFSSLLAVSSARALEWEPVEGRQQTISKPEPIKQDSQPGTPLTWTSVESPDASTKQQQSLNWTAVSEEYQTDAESVNSSIVWEQIEPGEIITTEDIELDEAPDEVLVTVEPSGTTFANDKAIWRDEMWFPQISSMVPVGFGPKGTMVTAGVFGIDCTASGICSKPDSWNEYQDQLEAFGEAQYDLSLSVGDAEKLVGLTLTASLEETQIPLGGRNTQNLENDSNFLSEFYVGAHLSRNIGPDTAIRAGIKNWIQYKECGVDCGFPRSAYGVISQRIRLNPDQNKWFANAYLTAGIGNGEFRPLDEQVRASIAAQRSAGCSTYGYRADKPCSYNTLRRAVLDAADYGRITPIGAAALEVVPGFNAIGEWSGRNLNLGFSVRPFPELGLVFTSMWNNLIQNCDYGCKVDVPDYPGGAPIPDNMITYRPIWSLTMSLDMKF